MRKYMYDRQCQTVVSNMYNWPGAPGNPGYPITGEAAAASINVKIDVYITVVSEKNQNMSCFMVPKGKCHEKSWDNILFCVWNVARSTHQYNL